MVRRQMWIVTLYVDNNKVNTIYFKNWYKLKQYKKLMSKTYKYIDYYIDVKCIYRTIKSLKTIIN